MTERIDYSKRPPEQLPIPGMTPQEGDQYQNLNTHNIYTVIEVIRARKLRVALRGHGRTTQVPLGVLERHYRPYPASSRLR